LVLPLGIESGGFHIYGYINRWQKHDYSMQYMGQTKDVSKSWRTTDNALENDAELRNDNYLNLDELRQASRKLCLILSIC
jgi:uncharacterized protein (DUF927 family)